MTMAAARPQRSDVALLAIAAIVFLFFMAKAALLAPPVVPGEFDAARAFARLERILGDERPHPVDSAANDAVRDRLLSEIRALGYEPETRDDFTCRHSVRAAAVVCARVRNILFRAGPAGGGAVLIASHYDSVGAGPGAADDGAGVAASLEIAAILKNRRPVKQVRFLITDGEEAGLLGAASFVKTDPYADEVEAVINMEARGVAGPALMFQTSAPNGRDIDAFAVEVRRPFANSTATDIYRLMPNDTDLTEFLSTGTDAVNFAFIGNGAFYHTPSDNLANLDRRSLGHIGASALSTLDGFLAANPSGPERSVIFTDLVGRTLIVLPQIAGLLMSIAGVVAAVFAFFRPGEKRSWRAALAPLCAVAIAGALCFAALSLVDLLRAEAYYWFAAPYAAQAIIYLSAIAGAALALLYIARQEYRRAARAASWFWFSMVGVTAAFLMPGASILIAIPAAIYACAVVASTGAPRLLPIFAAIAVAAAFAINLPLFDLGEQALGFRVGAVLAMAGALIASLALMSSPDIAARRTLVATILLSGLIGAIALAVTVPAYSSAAPRPLNIQHVVEEATGAAYFSLSPPGEDAPRAMAAVAPFERIMIEGLKGERVAARAPRHDGVAIGVEILSDAAQGDARDVAVQFSANGADELVISAPSDAALSAAMIDGETFSFDGAGERTFRCVGRACSTFLLRARVGAAPAAWTVYSIRRGLGAESAAMQRSRPGKATPIHGGDTRLVISKVTI